MFSGNDLKGSANEVVDGKIQCGFKTRNSRNI